MSDKIYYVKSIRRKYLSVKESQINVLNYVKPWEAIYLRVLV